VLDVIDRHALLLLQIEQHAGSITPQRVPIINPSSGVSPIVVSTLLPWRMAQRLAPVTKMRRDVRLAAAPVRSRPGAGR